METGATGAVAFRAPRPKAVSGTGAGVGGGSGGGVGAGMGVGAGVWGEAGAVAGDEGGGLPIV